MITFLSTICLHFISCLFTFISCLLHFSAVWLYFISCLFTFYHLFVYISSAVCIPINQLFVYISSTVYLHYISCLFTFLSAVCILINQLFVDKNRVFTNVPVKLIFYTKNEFLYQCVLLLCQWKLLANENRDAQSRISNIWYFLKWAKNDFFSLVKEWVENTKKLNNVKQNVRKLCGFEPSWDPL